MIGLVDVYFSKVVSYFHVYIYFMMYYLWIMITINCFGFFCRYQVMDFDIFKMILIQCHRIYSTVHFVWCVILILSNIKF